MIIKRNSWHYQLNSVFGYVKPDKRYSIRGPEAEGTTSFIWYWIRTSLLVLMGILISPGAIPVVALILTMVFLFSIVPNWLSTKGPRITYED